MASAAKKNAPAAVEQTGPGTDEDFEFPSTAGVVRLPSLARVPFGVVRKIRKLAPAEQVIAVIEESADDAALKVIDQLQATEVGEMYRAWADFSGVEVGKLPAS